MTERSSTMVGIWLMVATTFVFAMQDGISRHLAGEYNVLMVVMIRYWFFAAFVIAIAVRRAGGLKAAAATKQPWLQTFRAVLLVAEICVMVQAFVLLGLIESHAVFTSYPLLIAALSGPILGERVGWRRWAAIAVGFVGVLIILQPGFGVFSPLALVPLAAAFMFALYGLLTRYAARQDSAATSFFWTGTVGAVAITLVGIWFWEPMTGPDWVWMSALCVTGALGHFLLIKCYEVAEASAVQPFAYLQLVFASILGVTLFGVTIRVNVAIVAVAKGPDRDAGREVFYVEGKPPIRLPGNDPVLYYLQRLRDEAHRFAITGHRAKRAKQISENPLDDIPGVGAARKKALLAHFGSARSVARANLADLEAVEGVSAALARRIYDHFQDSA